MAEALLALGGNVGDVRATLDRAVAHSVTTRGASARPLRRTTARRPGASRTSRRSSISASQSKPGSRRTTLLERAQAVERALGRDRAQEQRWGPRPVDIDLLAYDDMILQRRDLTLPHPRLFERAFVLVPLAEIAPERVIAGTRVADALAKVDTKGVVKLPPQSQ